MPATTARRPRKRRPLPDSTTHPLLLKGLMDLQRISIKFYLHDDGEAISPEEAFRIFTSWIPTTADEVLVDVADYSHIAKAQQTLLVGHDANYCVDTTDGRKGLLYSRKRPVVGTTAERLRDAFATALRACGRLERDAGSEGVRFKGEEALLTVNDRLNAPNDEETLAAIAPELDSVLQKLFGGAETEVERNGDARQLFSLRLRARGEFDIDALIENLS